MWIIAYGSGSEIENYNFVGPYKDVMEAADFARKNSFDTWFTIELISPTELGKHS